MLERLQSSDGEQSTLTSWQLLRAHDACIRQSIDLHKVILCMTTFCSIELEAWVRSPHAVAFSPVQEHSSMLRGCVMGSLRNMI